MTDKKPSRPSRTRPAKKAAAPKSAPKVESTAEEKEIKAPPAPAEPVKAPEPPKAESILPERTVAKSAPPEDDPAPPAPVQTLYGAGKIKNRMRNRRA